MIVYTVVLEVISFVSLCFIYSFLFACEIHKRPSKAWVKGSNPLGRAILSNR